MKERFSILQLIKAHYSNNFELFDNTAKMLADILAEDGDIQAKDEILRMMKNKGEYKSLPDDYIPRNIDMIPEKASLTQTQKAVINEESDTYEDSNVTKENDNVEKKDSNNADTDIENQMSFSDFPEILPDTETVKSKRHRRTKAEMEEFRKSPEYLEMQNKPKRHRRTKAEMEATRAVEDNTEIIDSAKDNDSTVDIKPKRHRRTKAEMEEFRKSPEYLEMQNKPKRHRRTKAEMEAARLENAK